MKGGKGINQTYHEQAQQFISSSRAKGYSVRAEGDEIVAYPKGAPHSYTTPTRLDRAYNAVKLVGGVALNAAKAIIGQDDAVQSTVKKYK